ncbi:hypothetical protein HID58_066262 [Brassica napus]|uniref:Uncharacterized protein n=1 Tax=Brassica napus TaxID=3708 RepID=A0ABQ7ZF76_BRANA|nr:hypothetical protein HID58_066262 [Brassica napus]
MATTDAFTNLVTLGAKSKLIASVPKLLLDYVFSASSSHHRSFSASSSHHRSFSSSLLHQATTDASLLHQATTDASLLHQATTGASLLHQASTGASLMQRIQISLISLDSYHCFSVRSMIDAFVYIQIRNMAEKVPYYIYLVTSHRHHFHMVEEGMEGNPVAGTMKKFSRIIAFLSIPILMGIEKVTITLPPSLDSLMLIISNDFFWACIVLLLAHFQPVYSWLLNLPDAVTSSSTGQPKPPSPIPFSFEQPKDQSVIGHEDPPMVNKEASGPQASRVENKLYQ